MAKHETVDVGTVATREVATRQPVYQVRHTVQVPAWYRRHASILWPLATVIVMLVIWEAGCRMAGIPDYILPSPTKVASVGLERGEYLLWHATVTTLEILAGFMLSLIVGVMIAILITASRTFEQAIYPILIVSQAVPKIAVAPLLLVWFGFGWEPKMLVAFLIAFFPVVIDTVTGIQSVPTAMHDLARSMGASRLQTMTRFVMPHALPHLFSGIKVAITLAVSGAIIGEFVGADKGIGYVLLLANGRMETPLVFAGIIILSVVAMLLFYVIQFVERLCLPWHVSTQISTHGRM
jgi:NitT/TauT family transport system permease protein